MQRTTKLYILLALTILFFFLELISGYYAGSIALIADSFHMLSDILSLIVALYAIKLAGKTNHDAKYSYGWQRAEVLGALVNAVFLLALCFTIYIESIQRFFEPQEITKPVLVLGVGGAGLVVNLIGIFLFSDAHSHGGHSHSHGGQAQSHAAAVDAPLAPSNEHVSGRDSAESDDALFPPEDAPPTADEMLQDLYAHPIHAKVDIIRTGQHARSASNVGAAEAGLASASSDGRHGHGHEEGMMNMHGVFLHVLGDALGSIGVMISGTIIWQATGWHNRHIIDPIISIFITTLIVWFSIPLVRSASFILLQAVPQHVPIEDVRRDIISLPGVVSFHELHIWQLSDTKMVASVHVRVRKSDDPTLVQRRVQALFHGYGIHSTTVQPEIVRDDYGTTAVNGSSATMPGEGRNETSCLLRCADTVTTEAAVVNGSSSGRNPELAIQFVECGQKRCCPSPLPSVTELSDSSHPH